MSPAHRPPACPGVLGPAQAGAPETGQRGLVVVGRCKHRPGTDMLLDRPHQGRAADQARRRRPLGLSSRPWFDSERRSTPWARHRSRLSGDAAANPSAYFRHGDLTVGRKAGPPGPPLDREKMTAAAPATGFVSQARAQLSSGRTCCITCGNESSTERYSKHFGWTFVRAILRRAPLPAE